jgi:flagellar basal body rod protein FlgC
MISGTASATALSGARGQTGVVSAAAANLANQQTVGALPTAGGSGARQPRGQCRGGLVAAPNVDTTRDLLTLKTASRAYYYSCT